MGSTQAARFNDDGRDDVVVISRPRGPAQAQQAAPVGVADAEGDGSRFWQQASGWDNDEDEGGAHLADRRPCSRSRGDAMRA
jgi:hypothetical protein